VRCWVCLACLSLNLIFLKFIFDELLDFSLNSILAEKVTFIFNDQVDWNKTKIILTCLILVENQGCNQRAFGGTWPLFENHSIFSGYLSTDAWQISPIGTLSNIVHTIDIWTEYLEPCCGYLIKILKKQVPQMVTNSDLNILFIFLKCAGCDLWIRLI